MVQFINLPESTPGRLSRELGTALGQGVARNFPQPEQMVQRGMLQEAFSKLDPNLSYEEQIKEIAPTLLTTQGGSEALSTLAPLMQKRALNKAQRDSINARRGREGTGQSPQAPQTGEADTTPTYESPPNQIQNLPDRPPSPEDKFRRPTPPVGTDPRFPHTTAGPKPTPLMSPQDLENFALDLQERSIDSASPMSYADAMQLGIQENANRQAQNDQIFQEQQRKENSIAKQSSDMVTRAVNEGFIKPGDDPARKVVEQLAYEARNAQTPVDAWDYTRSGIKKFEQAREALKREQDLPGPFTKIYRRLTGTYKDLEKLQRDLRPIVDEYKKYGLVDEARSELMTGLGMGPEDAEMTMFPFSSDENKVLDSMPYNPSIAPRMRTLIESPMGKAGGVVATPDLGLIKDPEKFSEFKNDIAKYFEKFPESNLVTLRGRLTREKGYNWQDFSKAVSELIEEQRFDPDYYQQPQLPIINQMPMPGLSKQFEGLIKSTK